MQNKRVHIFAHILPICVYVYMCICVYIYIHICTYIYTFISTYDTFFSVFSYVCKESFRYFSCEKNKRSTFFEMRCKKCVNVKISEMSNVDHLGKLII